MILWGLDQWKDQKTVSQLLGNLPNPYFNFFVPADDTLPGSDENPEQVLVVAFGTKPMAVLQQHKVIPKGRTLSWCRYPRTFDLPNGNKVLVTYSPSIKDIDYAKYLEMQWDLNLVRRFAQHGHFDPVVGDYEFTQSLEEVLTAVNTVDFSKPVKTWDVALDLETLGLDPYHPDAYIVSVQVSYKPGHTLVVPFGSKADEEQRLTKAKDAVLREQLNLIMNNPRISLRGANLKYDLNWLAVRGELECTNFRFDTMLVGSLLDENRHNSLKNHTKLYVPNLGGYDDKFDATYDKGRMDKVLLENPDDFLQYAGGDTDACLQTSMVMKEQLLADKGLSAFYVNVLHPAARAYEMVERTGILVDVPYYLEFEFELEQELERIQKQGLALLPYSLVLKHQDNLSLTKASLIVDFLFTPQGLNLKPKMVTAKTGAPSTAAEHLQQFAQHKKAGPFVQCVLEYQDIAKTLSTYVIKRDKEGNPCGGFLSHLRLDRRFHPTYFLHNSGDGTGGTNTGRLSVRDPAMQTVPKHTKWAKRLRRAFIAPDGYLVMGNDYSQGELKIAACLAHEEKMIAAYLQGKDLHALSGAERIGVPFEEFMKWADEEHPKHKEYKRVRQGAKAGNFGFLYGMGAEGFVHYAKSTYGVIVTLQEAEEIRESFFTAYPGLVKWHEAYKTFAAAKGYIRSPLGRVRHLPMINSKFSDVRSKEERRAINAPVQSTLSDMSLWATALLDPYPHSQVVCMIHDQLLSYVKEDRWEEAAKHTVHTMENLPFEKVGWNPPLKFTVDFEIGPNMADMEAMKLAA